MFRKFHKCSSSVFQLYYDIIVAKVIQFSKHIERSHENHGIMVFKINIALPCTFTTQNHATAYLVLLYILKKYLGEENICDTAE